MSTLRFENPPVSLPDGISASFTDAGSVFNEASLVGEALDVDLTPVADIFEAVERSRILLATHYPDAARQSSTLDAAEVQIFADGYSEVLVALSAAIDDAGRPRGEAGAQLAASEHVATDDDGRLYMRVPGLRLWELRERLEELVRLLTFAASQSANLEWVD
jgi:hypothetical protein